jgi:integrase
MPAKKLTNAFCESKSRTPKSGRAEFYDSLVPGLALRVNANGNKKFILTARYPSNPKNPVRRTLGNFFPEPDEADDDAPLTLSLPDLAEGNSLTLRQARRKAREWLLQIENGSDPRAGEAKRLARVREAAQNTFRHVADQFLRRYVKGAAYCELERLAGELRRAQSSLKPGAALRRVLADPANAELVAKSKKEGLVKKQAADSIINGEFVKQWGDRPAGDISPRECAAAIRAIVERGTPEQARTAFEWLRRLYSWCIGVNEFGISTSPVATLRPSDLIGKKTAKDRVLSDEELRAIWAACDDMGHPYGPAVRMLILTGQRLREVAGAPWGEFDLDKKTWVIAPERMKGDHGVQLVPLAKDALALVTALPRFVGGEFSFSTNGRRPVNGWSRTKERLDGLCEVKNWTFHDLRRTMRSHLSALPIEEHVREMMIGHRPVGIKKVYDRHLYEAEKRAGFELWEDRLLSILVPLAPLAPLAPAEEADLGVERAARGAA